MRSDLSDNQNETPEQHSPMVSLREMTQQDWQEALLGLQRVLIPYADTLAQAVSLYGPKVNAFALAVARSPLANAMLETSLAIAEWGEEIRKAMGPHLPEIEAWAASLQSLKTLDEAQLAGLWNHFADHKLEAVANNQPVTLREVEQLLAKQDIARDAKDRSKGRRDLLIALAIALASPNVPKCSHFAGSLNAGLDYVHSLVSQAPKQESQVKTNPPASGHAGKHHGHADHSAPRPLR